MKLSSDNPIILRARSLVQRKGMARFMPSFLRYGGWLVLIPYRLIGMNTMLLTTTGRKSNLARTSPVMFIKDGEDYVISAHYGGADKHPNWYHNLSANPDVTVELFWRRHPCRAEEVSDEAEKAALLEQFPYGMVDAFQGHTARAIPVIRLQPAA